MEVLTKPPTPMQPDTKIVPLLDSLEVELEEHHPKTRPKTTSGGPNDIMRRVSLLGFKSFFPLTLLKWSLVILSCGIFGLFLLWNVRLRYKFFKRCPESEAEVFLTQSVSGSWVVTPVVLQYGQPCFECEGNRYYWDGSKYVQYTQHLTWTHHDIVSMNQGLSGDDLSDLNRIQPGPNVIEIPVTPLIEDILHAFFGPTQVYQYFCCLVWYIHNYPAFSTMLVLALLISTSLVIYNNRKSMKRLREMAYQQTVTEVFRGGQWNSISSIELLPGDLIKLQEDFKCPCDLVLVSGTALIDESSLTGESLPVVKTQPEDDKSQIFDPDRDKRHCIFSSTTVLSSSPGPHSDDVIAVVCRTGYKTTKGQLVKTILHTKPYHYPYQIESYIFLGILMAIGFILFWTSLWIWGVFDPQKGIQTKEQILYGFESIVCLVPPFLPIIFDVTLLICAKNLEWNRIYTTSPSRIPVAGKVKTMCFDKTGTLTKVDLDVIGVVPGKMLLRESDETIKPVIKLMDDDEVLHCLASCHSLTSIGEVTDITESVVTRSYSGPTLDIKMFEYTGWKYNQGYHTNYSNVVSPNNYSIELVKRFDFDNSIQRMSTLIKKDNSFFAYVKGSGESIQSICDPSTVPDNYQKYLRKFSRDGCYVIALAGRPFPEVTTKDLSDITRQDIDKNLTFLGLLLLRNELKPDSTDAIYHIKQGRIRPVMVTGDNLFTAFYIAKRCGIVFSQNNYYFCGTLDEKEHRVIFQELEHPKITLDPYNWIITHEDGTTERIKPERVNIGIETRAFDELRAKGHNEFLVKNVQVFARMRPLQKQEVIDIMMDSGEIVGMCGDGANDCAALNRAHFGVALSEAEASLIAPFTAQSLSAIACVDLIKQGRACMASSFSAFKLTLYHAIVVNTTAMFIAFTFGSDLSQGEYLITDFFCFFLPMFFIIRTIPAEKLQGNPPTSKIFGPTTLASFIPIVIISWVSEGLAITLLKQQPWFTPHAIGNTAIYDIPETTTLFLLAVFLLCGASVAVSFGATWRQPIYQNYFLIMVWILQLITVIFIYTVPHLDNMTTLRELMDMVALPGDFRAALAVLGASSFIVIILWEKIIVIGPVADYLRVKTGRGRPEASHNPIWG